MKFINKKILIITSLVCLLPVIAGLVLWNRLPESVPVHFDINSNPDSFAPKWFAVIMIPVILAVFQTVCCIGVDYESAKHGSSKKIGIVSKWIVPLMSVIINVAIYIYALGIKVDIRVVACIAVGFIFLIIGNYLPKLNYIKNYSIDTEKARKINRFSGFEMVILGLLFAVSAFLPPYASVACLVLMFVFILVGVFYGIYVIKKK